MGPWICSTSLTTDGSGAVVSKQRYYPYGDVRDATGATPTDFGFTGQRLDASTGLMYYRARYYDPMLGRFISADTIVPEPGNPQSLNRYAYVKNNPLRYVDPSGNFSEEQLIDWFGENWSDLFNESWITILSAAELGDALVYNLSDNSAMTMIFAVKNGGLVGWDLGSGNFNDRKAMDLMDLQSKSNSRVLSLYRNPNCNLSGGSSQFPPESINLHYDARTFRHITGNAERSSITLPDDWYIGPYESVYTGGYLAGFDIGLSDMLDLGEDAITVGGAILAAKKLAPKAIGRKALAAFGGVYALAVLAVNIAEWSRWDTAYYVTNGTNLPPQPVPIPSSQ